VNLMNFEGSILVALRHDEAGTKMEVYASWIRGHDADARTVFYLRRGKASRAALSFRRRRRVSDQFEKDKARIKSSPGCGCQSSSWRSLPRVAGTP